MKCWVSIITILLFISTIVSAQSVTRDELDTIIQTTIQDIEDYVGIQIQTVNDNIDDVEDDITEIKDDIKTINANLTALTAIIIGLAQDVGEINGKQAQQQLQKEISWFVRGKQLSKEKNLEIGSP